jgi:hypothetical protein
VRTFKNRWFTRFARKEGIADVELRAVVNQLEAGQWDADLGGGGLQTADSSFRRR